MDATTARLRRQLTAKLRGTRQSQARFFLRCSPHMITVIDKIARENALSHGIIPRIGAFGLQFQLIK